MQILPVALFGNIFLTKLRYTTAQVLCVTVNFAAGCILPLTDNKNVDINLGTRHRAGLGISEQSDAVVLIVSEETGVISLAINGVLYRNFTRDRLIDKLEALLLENTDDDSAAAGLLQKIRRKSDEGK